MWRRGLAWVALAGLVGLIGAHAVGLVWGGMARVVAWLFALQLLPLAALGWWAPAVGWLAWRRRASLPHGLVLATSSATLLLAVPGYGPWPVAYPLTSLSSASPPASVRVPTDAEMIVAWGGDARATNAHASDPAQRWAYDLLIAPAGHGGAALEGYGCYGVPVLAPAAGVVTVALDGRPDQTPGALAPDWEVPAGNHVALRLETGTHLVVAHLQPGSVAVEVGEAVAEGQLLGRCGNSGNTSEPHVHLHHQRQDPARVGLVAEGLPLSFRDHEGPEMPTGGLALDGERVEFVGHRIRHRGP